MPTDETKILKLDVASDHVEGIATRGTPLRGIEELIWNALDADADNVSVAFETNALEAIVKITVADDGNGIGADSIDKTFGRLGGSLKRGQRTTPKGRFIHGKAGEGRFKSFVLGGNVEWCSTSKSGNGKHRLTVKGRIDDLTNFPCSKPVPADVQHPGTTVTVTNVHKGVTPGTLFSERARRDLLTRLAPYLKSFPGITINYDGKKLDVSELQRREATYDVTAGSVTGTLMVAPCDRVVAAWT